MSHLMTEVIGEGKIHFLSDGQHTLTTSVSKIPSAACGKRDLCHLSIRGGFHVSCRQVYEYTCPSTRFGLSSLFFIPAQIYSTHRVWVLSSKWNFQPNTKNFDTHIQRCEAVPTEDVFASLAQHLSASLVLLDRHAAHRTAFDQFGVEGDPRNYFLRLAGRIGVPGSSTIGTEIHFTGGTVNALGRTTICGTQGTHSFTAGSGAPCSTFIHFHFCKAKHKKTSHILIYESHTEHAARKILTASNWSIDLHNVYLK